jgi:hypothetical protein
MGLLKILLRNFTHSLSSYPFLKISSLEAWNNHAKEWLPNGFGEKKSEKWHLTA